MSEEENRSVIRTVTAPYRSRSDDEMNIIAMLYGLGLIIVLIPLLPFLIVIWALSVINRALGP